MGKKFPSGSVKRFSFFFFNKIGYTWQTHFGGPNWSGPIFNNYESACPMWAQLWTKWTHLSIAISIWDPLFLSCAEIFFFFFCFVLEVACVCGLRYMILRTYLSIRLFMTNFILNWLSRPSSWTQFQVTFFLFYDKYYGLDQARLNFKIISKIFYLMKIFHKSIILFVLK